MAQPRRLDLAPLPFGVPLFRAIADVHGAHRAPELYRKIIGRVGEAPVEEIGHGGHGVVYLLPSGRAMKVTWDPVEVDAMTMLKGLEHPNLVHVFDAFIARTDGDVGLGIVVREKLEDTLLDYDPALSDFLEEASDVAYDMYRAQRNRGAGHRIALLHAMSALVSHLYEEAGRTGEPLLMDIAEGIRQLGMHGLLGITFHGRNIGIEKLADRAHAVIFDFGRLATKRAAVAMMGKNSLPGLAYYGEGE